MFLRALGLRGADDILRAFYTVDRLNLKGGSVRWNVSDSLVGLRAAKDFPIPGGDITIGKGKKVTQSHVLALRKASIDAIEIDDTQLEGAFTAADIVDPESGEVILEANEELTPRVIAMAQEKNVELDRDLLPREGRDRPGALHDAEEGSDQDARRGADRDLPAPASRRSADARQLAFAVREHVLQPAEATTSRASAVSS